MLIIKLIVMKKLLLVACAFILALNMNAQKKASVEIHQAQARQVEPLIQTFIMPKVAEMSVGSERISFVTYISPNEANAMYIGDGLDPFYEMKAYALANTCKANNADVIVAATYLIDTDKTNGGYNVTVVGYPGIYEKWRDVQQGDYQWIQSVYNVDLSKDKGYKATESLRSK